MSNKNFKTVKYFAYGSDLIIEKFKDNFVHIYGRIYKNSMKDYVKINFIFPETDFSEQHFEELKKITEQEVEKFRSGDYYPTFRRLKRIRV